MKLIRDGVKNYDIFDNSHPEVSECYNFLFQEKNGNEKYVVFVFIDGCVKARHATGP